MHIRRVLKRSELLKGCVKAMRGGVADVRAIRGNLSRRSKIPTFLQSSGPKRLHLGASHNILPGWLNTDVSPASGAVRLDATRRFPFGNDTLDYVFSEHMIEHIDYNDAVSMLGECWRVLKPNGKIRIATPDLGVIVGLHTRQKNPAQQQYVAWVVDTCLPGVDFCEDVFVINTAFHAWGHRFLYDRASLRMTMDRCGFGDVTFHEPGESLDPTLKGLESHGKEIENEDVNRFETFVAEGRAVK
jgi:predicted SAM-dependent methyltransferase